MTEAINNPRAEINRIDAELLRLLNRRVRIALEVGRAKRSEGISLCDHRRENEVLAGLCAQNTGPLTDENVRNIFQRIIDESLHAQQLAFGPAADSDGQAEEEPGRPNFIKNARVAFLGEPGSFSEEAALKLLGDDCRPVPEPTFEELFKAIGRRKADYILAPLENTLAGSVHRCYDLLLESPLLRIAAEVILPISHFLVGRPGASFEQVETVESHPVALAQCENFFAAHPHIKRVAAGDTASSVRRVVEGNEASRAAVAGKHAARIYGGAILKEHLEDHSENYTRFALLSEGSVGVPGAGEKISLVVRLPHRPGALHDALRPFVRRSIDLLKIESRPIKGRPWQYNFYLDLRAPASESELAGALEEVRGRAEEVRYLGQYSSYAFAKEG